MFCIHLLLKCLEDKHFIIVVCSLPTACSCVIDRVIYYHEQGVFPECKALNEAANSLATHDNLLFCINDNTADCNMDTGVCTCNSGWTGTSCETDINECTVHSGICTGSNEECENIDGSHKCNCVVGFYRELPTIYHTTDPGCKGEIVLGCYVK